MKTSEEIKTMVREKYSEVADGQCCGSICCDGVNDIMSDRYDDVDGYVPAADLGLGCGLPVAFAKINKGDTILDLGSGAGNDCFVARAETGENGKVIGVDMTIAMIEKARTNAEKLKYNNIEFRLGDIEQLPVNSDSIDVVISNCVLNLVPDKSKAFAEIFRVLKPDGHFSISDIVLSGNLPDRAKDVSELYAGCVSGAIQKDQYISILIETGFKNIIVQKEKVINIPEDALTAHLTIDELNEYRADKAGIYSITVYGEKKDECCDKETCCK